MNKNIETALSASLTCFASVNRLDGQSFIGKLKEVFNLEFDFLTKVDTFDAVFDKHKQFGELRELFFDLLMINFFDSDLNRLEADYLESKEWEDIEEQTLERGTELLNLLLYINECHNENIKPDLEDFLKEFLLVEEDEFQDEFLIYEKVISNQHLAQSSVEEICANAKILKIGQEMKAFFVPFMAFFLQPQVDDKTEQELKKYSANPAFELAVYTLITNFNKK